MVANVQSMAYTGEIPWHKKGVSIESAFTSAEAIEKAGLDWKVKKQEMYTTINGNSILVPRKYANVRDDDGAILGTVGEVYKPLQNHDAFEFFDAVVGQKLAIYHTAGCLGVGEKVWMLAKLPGYIQVKGNDITEKYLLLTNSHDGSTPVQVLFTPIRVVCQNTLNIALQGTNQIKMRHSSLMMSKWESVRDLIGIVNAQYISFEESAKAMADRMLKGAEVNAFLNKVFKINADEKMATRTINILGEVESLFVSGRGNTEAGIKGTAWAAFNAVTEYVDHYRTSKGENRDKSALFGSGQELKQRAWDESLVLVRKAA